MIAGPTRGHAWSASAARLELHRTAIDAGVRRRLAPHQLRHAHAVELLHEGIPLPLIQRQLGHAYLSTTGTYLQGISSEEIISTVHARRAPMITPAPVWPCRRPAGAHGWAPAADRTSSSLARIPPPHERLGALPRGRSGKASWLLLVRTNSVVECCRRGWSRRRSGSRQAPTARSAVDCWFPPIRAMSSSRIRWPRLSEAVGQTSDGERAFRGTAVRRHWFTRWRARSSGCGDS